MRLDANGIMPFSEKQELSRGLMTQSLMWKMCD